MLMVVDTVHVVTTTKQCFCVVVNALLQLLLSVDIVDVAEPTDVITIVLEYGSHCLSEYFGAFADNA